MDYVLDIGGVAVEVLGSGVGPHPAFGHPLPLTRDRDAVVRVTQVERIDAPRGALLFDSGSVWKLFEDGDGYRIDCHSPLFGDAPYKSARVPRDLRSIEISIRVAGLDPLEFPLDELLINALLAQRRGVELHACGVIDAGRGLLFIGNSGDGKTTTARLWQNEPVEIVSDDRVVVRAENGAWTMYGTPWHGEAEICSPARAPLARIYVLDKSARNGVTPLRPVEAVARLFSCTFPPFHDRRGLATVVDTLGDLATSVPVARLSFANHPSAVDFVRQEAAA